MYKLPNTDLGQPTDLLNIEFLGHRVVSVGASTPVLLNSGTRRTRIIVQNYSDSASNVYIGSSDVAATGARRGLELPPGGGVILDFTNDIEVYAISASGTIGVLVVESF